MLHPDFFDILIHAKKQGLLLTLFTNGTLITPAVADRLAEWRPFSVEVSIYGNTRKTFETVTGVPGSFDNCRRGIYLLLERKLSLTLKTMVMTLNQHEIWEMQQWAADLGVNFRFDAVLNPRVDGSRGPCELRISPEQVVELDLVDGKRRLEWQAFIEKFLGPPAEPDELYHCGAGFDSFHINSYGDLSACLMARNPSYPLAVGSFHQGWQEFLPAVRQQKRQQDSPCNRCQLIAMCGQCPGWAQMENGDPEYPVEYLCNIAHLRAEAFGIKGPRNLGV